MKIAGVRLDGGRVAWVDVNGYEPVPLQPVMVRVPETAWGVVFVTPQEWVVPPDRVDGVLAEVLPVPAADIDCTDLPGAWLPPLGSMTVEPIAGIITELNAVTGEVTITAPDGKQVQVPAVEVRCG